jgi:hypothetical protein
MAAEIVYEWRHKEDFIPGKSTFFYD